MKIEREIIYKKKKTWDGTTKEKRNKNTYNLFSTVHTVKHVTEVIIKEYMAMINRGFPISRFRLTLLHITNLSKCHHSLRKLTKEKEQVKREKNKNLLEMRGTGYCETPLRLQYGLTPYPNYLFLTIEITSKKKQKAKEHFLSCH